jgi:hypothetical protein
LIAYLPPQDAAGTQRAILCVLAASCGGYYSQSRLRTEWPCPSAASRAGLARLARLHLVTLFVIRGLLFRHIVCEPARGEGKGPVRVRSAIVMRREGLREAQRFDRFCRPPGGPKARGESVGKLHGEYRHQICETMLPSAPIGEMATVIDSAV